MVPTNFWDPIKEKSYFQANWQQYVDPKEKPSTKTKNTHIKCIFGPSKILFLATPLNLSKRKLHEKIKR